MKKRNVLVAIAVLSSVVGLLVASCGTTTQTTTQSGTVAPTSKFAATTTAAATQTSPDKPKYGGTLTQRVTVDPAGFDDQIGLHQSLIPTGLYTNEELLQGDWAKGPFGTGENDWLYGFIGRIGLETGRLAESWEIPDSGTVIWHIRKGIHWQNKPPANGREYTADDAAFNLSRWLGIPTSWMYMNYVPQGYAPTSVKATDKYTVEAKIPAKLFGQMFVTMSDFGIFHYPPEAVKQYGNMADWKNACGTGPFILTDFVPGSSVSFVRNPNYWMKDPLHPDNQLPYVDGVKQLIIPDPSTAQAALRTGKLDVMDTLSWDDGSSLMKTTPDLLNRKVITAPIFPAGRVDKPELPFKDVKVRQALNMAVNKQNLIDKYYSGHAYLVGYPYPPTKIFEKIYTPLDQQNATVQSLYKYDPEGAKKILAAAGYPNGFKTTIDCLQTDVDLLSIVREDLLKVGVDMAIRPLEPGVFQSENRARGNKEMIMKGAVDYTFPWRLMMVRPESMDNPACLPEDPVFRTAYETMGKAIGIDDTIISTTLKEISKYSLEQAWAIWLPAYDSFIMWWPWLQNFGGVTNGGYDNRNDWTKYIWIDTSLKKSMGR